MRLSVVFPVPVVSQPGVGLVDPLRVGGIGPLIVELEDIQAVLVESRVFAVIAQVVEASLG